MMPSFVLSCVFGWFGHKLKPGIADLFPGESTNRLASYAVGSLLMLVAFVVLTAGKLGKDDRDAAVSQLLIAMLAIGLGTTAGTIADHVRASE